MNTQVSKIDQHKRELSIQVEGDIVKEKYDAVYKKINKEANVAGFRPGNVPRDILEKNYSSVANQEILKELIPEVYSQALDEVKLEPVSLPEISDINLGKYSLSFKAKVEVKPSIELKNYKGLKLEYKNTDVADEEIDTAFNKLKENNFLKDKDTHMSDEECVHSLGYPNLGALKEVIKRQIYLEKVKVQQANIENSIVEQLIKQVNFQVPPALVAQQLDRLIKQAEMDFALRGMSKEDIEKQHEELSSNLKPGAEKQMRVYLLLEEVARRENISRDDKVTQRVIEFLLRQADWNSIKN